MFYHCFSSCFKISFSVYSRDGQPTAREPHAAPWPLSCDSFAHALFLLLNLSAAYSSEIMLRLAMRKIHYHVIITLLRELRGGVQ